MRVFSISMLVLPLVALTSCDKVNDVISKASASKKKPAAVTAPKPVASIAALKPEGFAAFTASSKQRVVVVKFHAPEDADHPQLTQQIDSLTKNFPYQLAIGTLDIAQSREFAAKESVTVTPEVRIYRDGACVERLTAAQLAQVETSVAAQVALQKPNMAVELASKKSAIGPEVDAEGKPVAPKEAAVQLMQKDWKPAGFERAMVPKSDPNAKDKAALGKLINNAKGLTDSMASTGNSSTATSYVRELNASTNLQAYVADSQNKVEIIEFYADWSGACRELSPRLEKIVAQSGGKVILGKFKIDQAGSNNKAVLSTYGVSSIPDVRIYRGGVQVDKFVGALDEAELQKRINAQISKLEIPKSKPVDGTNPAPAQPAVEPIKPMEKGWVPSGMEKR